MTFTVETEQEDDGRWIAEVLELPGALAYGHTPEEALAKVQALALLVIADRLDHAEAGPDLIEHFLRGCMSTGPSTRARRVLAALVRIGWRIKRQAGSHRVLSRPGWPDVVFAFHDAEETGPRMLARIAKRIVLEPDDM